MMLKKTCKILGKTNKTNLSFGQAIEELKLGKKLQRRGWNGCSLYIYYVPRNKYQPTTNAGEELADEDGLVPYQEYIALKTMSKTVVPWTASQTDILSNDWRVID